MILFDGWGVMGLALDYAIIFIFSGSAAVLFLYFWKKGRLNFEEDPKYQMLDEDSQ